MTIMRPEHFNTVRELFLIATNLDEKAQEEYLAKVRIEQPDEIYLELTSLLDEHDPTNAKQEGSNPSTFRYVIAERSTAGQHSLNDQANSGQTEPSSSDQEKNQPQHFNAPTTDRIASSFLVKSQAKKTRRRNNAWLWITALLPTALIGLLTYYQVNKTMKQAVRDEMRGVSDSVAHAARRFLSDKSHLVESWTREPAIQSTIRELIKPSTDTGGKRLLNTSLVELIGIQLDRLSGINDVHFAIWGSDYQFLCTNLSGIASKNLQTQRDIQSWLGRAEKDERVIFGPMRLSESDQEQPSPTEMGILTAVRDDNDAILAIILVTRIGMHQEFSRMFFDIANAGNLDAYAVDETGTMLTESPRAATLASSKRLDVTVEGIAASLRVADPGKPIKSSDTKLSSRSNFPLTKAAKSVCGGQSAVDIQPYRNYAGIEVVGSWRWNGDSKNGIIVERPASQAFATVRIVQASFIGLGTLLFLSVTTAAAFLARATAAERAAVHPLSRYEVVEEVGTGGMGMVFRANHRQLGRETALKVMIGGTQRKEDQLRFDREARLAASLSNPHSVTIYDYGRSEDGESYCVMEFLRGLTLQEVVDRSGHQPIGRVLFIIRQVCEAISEAHQKRLLHLDIKPQNIMLSLDQAVGDWAVLFDYGLSKPITPTLEYYRSPMARWSGTPMYMAPERFHHLDQVDQRADIYSLGCVAYFLITGSTPFFESDTESLFTLIANQQPIDPTTRRGEPVPNDVANLIIKCMAKNPEDRFHSIEEFVLRLEQIQISHPWTADDSRHCWKIQSDHLPKTKRHV